MNKIKELTEQLSKVINEEELTNRERLIAYCDHILDSLLTLELNEFPSINETQEYIDIEYYAEQIKNDLIAKIDLES